MTSREQSFRGLLHIYLSHTHTFSLIHKTTHTDIYGHTQTHTYMYINQLDPYYPGDGAQTVLTYGDTHLMKI